MLDNFYHHAVTEALIPFVGKPTAEDVLRQSKQGAYTPLQGQRVWVAVLMVDIRGFTSLSERLGPQQIVSLLEEFRSQVSPIVHQYGGAIDKFIGDSVMVVFGLPSIKNQSDPDQRAVDCALTIMQRMGDLNARIQEFGIKEEISVGIGIASGDVIAGNVKSGDRIEHTVIGSAVNLVARLEDIADKNQILISSVTHSRLKGSVMSRALPPQKLRGFHEDVTAYDISFRKSRSSEDSSDGTRSAVNE
jgi:adenylate cyclase